MSEIRIGKKVFVLPDEGSPCDLWRAYFDKLKGEVGAKNARVIWLITWAERSKSSCSTNAEFNKWLKKNKIDVSTAASRAVADISKIGSNVLGLGKNMTRMLSIAVPVLLGSVLITVIVVLVNSAKKTDATDVLAAFPATRAMKAGGVTKLLK